MFTMADAVKATQKPAPRPTQAPEAAQPEEGKKKKKRGGLVGLIILFVLLIGAGVFLYFTIVNDWGGVRTSALTFVNKLDPEFRYVKESQYIEYQEAVDQLEAAQTKLEQDIAAFEKTSAAQKADLEKRQKELTEAEIFVLPLYRRGLSDDKINELKQLGKIYENMDAKTAAGIITRLYDDSHIAAILYYMSAPAAADVMANLSAELAARVTTELLRD